MRLDVDSWWDYYFLPFDTRGFTMRRIGITTHTVADLQTLATIVPQLGDQVMISDLGHAVFKYVPTAGTDDGQNIIVQTIGADKYSWVRQGLNLVGAFDVPVSAIGDNLSETYEVAATGMLRDAVYLASVVSGEPASANGAADYQLVRPSANDKLAVQVTNNTGAALTAGTLKLNIFRIGG